MNNLPIPQSRIENLMNAFISRDSSRISAPQSRVEEFWYHLIEGTNSLPIPQSRIELLLKKIIENDTEQIPLAQSRAEEFLVSILTGDINKLPIPQSRSEYYLDYIARNNLVLDDIEYVKYSGTNITASNTVQKPFRSAILKGSTKYRDIDTGEILEAFEEGRNLELVSVKMPVLKTTGKNLCDGVREYNGANDVYGANFIKVEEGKRYGIYQEDKNFLRIDGYSNNKEFVTSITGGNAGLITIPSGVKYIKWKYPLYGEPYNENSKIMIALSDRKLTLSDYEPYKSNILTVNEDVTLRSNGDVCDELNLLTGRLTQRIDENNEVLAQEVVKTVDLKVVNQDGNQVKELSAFDGTTYIVSGSASDNSLIAITEVEVPTKLIEVLDGVKSLSSDVEILINEVDNTQKLQDENSTMAMSAMTELYEMILMMGGND